jgi:hypothetical protein
MKSRFLLLAFLLCAAFRANAQTLTTVTGTVTDVNTVPYAGARVTFTLNSPGGPTPSLTPCTGPAAQSGCQFQVSGPVTTNLSGVFTVNLYANASILPAATTYTITVNEPGAPPPLGTGPQVCTLANQTISGATQAISMTSCPALSVVTGAGGAVSSVSNSDSTLTISPNVGAVVASINLAQPNTWTGLQTGTISASALTPFAPLQPNGDTTTVALGPSALANQSAGAASNTATGEFAGEYISTATGMTANGFSALKGASGNPTTGGQDTATGYDSLPNCQGGCQGNTADGEDTGLSVTTGSKLTISGYDAGGTATTATNSEIYGALSHLAGATDTNEIVIGYDLGGGGSNTVNLGGILTATGTATPSTSTVTIPGNLVVDGTCTGCGGGGGNTTSTSLSNNFLTKANGPNSIINSLCSDTGTLFSCSDSSGAQFASLTLTNQNSWVLGNGTQATASFYQADSGSGLSNTTPAYLTLGASPADAYFSYLFPCLKTGAFCESTVVPTADSSSTLVVHAPANEQTLSTYTIGDADEDGLTTYNYGTSPYNVAVTLPCPSGTAFANGWKNWQKNITPSGTVTITISGSCTIQQAGTAGTTATISAGASAQLTSDGVNFQILGGTVSGGTVTSVATASPITGGPFTTSGTVMCPTCATGPGTSTTNDLAAWSNTAGLPLIDTGILYTNVVTLAGTQTLTNKSISGAQINSGTVGAAYGGVAEVNTSGQGFAIGFFINAPAGAGSTVGVTTAETVWAFQFVLPYQITVNHMGFYVSTAAVGTCDFGIYSAAGSLLVNTGGVSCDTAGGNSVASSSSVQLNPGVYYFAWTSTATTFLTTAYASSANECYVQTGVFGSSGTAASSGVLPSSLGTITNSCGEKVPVVAFTP